MLVYLKVKIKSLAAEATIIRKEEAKAKRLKHKSERHERAFFGLKSHRRNEVRDEARHSLLAYGFLRGRRYSQIENQGNSSPDWKRVRQLITKFCEQAVNQDDLIKMVDAWRMS
jgi:hypothetical protein